VPNGAMPSFANAFYLVMNKFPGLYTYRFSLFFIVFDSLNGFFPWHMAEAGKVGFISLELTPVLINRCQVNLAEGADYDCSIRHMQPLPLDFGTH
jgi:hypothetical protein